MPTPRTDARLVTTQADLETCCAALGREAELPLDTEFARTDTYRPRLCLVQVATPGTAWCIDALAGLDTAPLWRAIAATRALKVMHAAKQDLEVLALSFGGLPGPLFDTQIAAGLLGHPPQAGYATLVEAEFGVRLDKSQTRTDWSRRPLTAAQLAYAAEDVAWLPDLARLLRERLAAMGRLAWAEEESAALLDPALYGVRPERAFDRLTGLEYQPVAMQARARRLAAWREVRADQADRPRQWILSDQALLALAGAAPADLAGIEALQVMAPGAIRNSGAAILGELRAAEADLAGGVLSLAQLPRPAAADNGNLKRLAGVVQKAAGELGIAAEILATRSEMTALMRGSRTVRPLRGWRRAVVGEALLGALS
jgi:ribonuclease D